VTIIGDKNYYGRGFEATLASWPTRPRSPRRPHHRRVCARIAQRILAVTAANWHNDTIGARIRRSLTAYDH